MLQNARVTAFTVSELLRENPQIKVKEYIKENKHGKNIFSHFIVK